jgi:hypothetical protein
MSGNHRTFPDLDNDCKFSKAFDALFETEDLHVIHTFCLASNANAKVILANLTALQLAFSVSPAHLGTYSDIMPNLIIQLLQRAFLIYLCSCQYLSQLDPFPMTC